MRRQEILAEIAQWRMFAVADPQLDGPQAESVWSERQAAIFFFLEGLVAALGPFSQGVDADGAHYLADNPFVGEGLACQYCAFYQSENAGGTCSIVEDAIVPEGLCKYWLIPDPAQAPTDQAPAPDTASKKKKKMKEWKY